MKNPFFQYSINASNNYGGIALMAAATEGNLPILLDLFCKGVDAIKKIKKPNFFFFS